MKYLNRFNESNKETFFFSQDGDSHWYMIPSNLKERWLELNRTNSDDNDELINSEFSEYMTGGGIENIHFENPIRK